MLLCYFRTVLKHILTYFSSVIKLAAHSPGEPALDIVVVVDPVSRGAQKVGPILSILHQTTNCHIRIFFNCVEKNSDMPLKR